jgi:restriction system protein
MTRRQARRGKNRGKSFWGCTGYPECRGVREIGDRDE